MTQQEHLPRARRPVLGVVCVLAAASLWATFGLFAKVLYAAGFEPVELASVRAAVGAACIAVFALPRLRRGGSARVPLHALPFLAAYGTLGFALFGLLLLATLQHTTVAIGVALLYTAPAFVLLLSAVVWRERVTGLRAGALVMVLAGVVLVTGAAGSLLRGTAALSTSALVYGIGAGLGYAAYTMFSKVATHRYGPLTSLFWCFLFAAVALAFAASPLTPFVRRPEYTGWLIALGVVPAILPYGLYLAALRELPASTASMLASLEPAVAAILAASLIGERMDAMQAAGIALIVGAAVLLSREKAAVGGGDV